MPTEHAALRTPRGCFFRKFRTSQDGSATIEAVLWLPFFIFFLVMIADTSFVFNGQAQITRVTQDANRALSVGRFKTAAETQNFIISSLSTLSTHLSVTTTVNNGVIKTAVLVPVNDLVAVGLYGFLKNYNIRVSAEHYVEY